MNGMDVQQPDPGRISNELGAVLRQVCEQIRTAGGRAWLVGGSVRDLSLGVSPRDLDLEVFGLPPERLQAALQKRFTLDLVGASYGILKVKGAPIDIGLPRRETKTGRGHQAFAIDADPDLSLPEAAARRDFTLNSMYLDPLTGELSDPWNGWQDLRDGILRHTSPAFVEDPLRVLRAMQFSARFDLQPAAETVALCRTIGLEGLAAERILEEWKKLLTLGVVPSRGLEFLRATGWLDHFPELAALPGVPQDPKWHPEGDAWVHTLHCLDAFAEERIDDYHEDLVVGFAVLCHDLGKPDTTGTTDDGRIRSMGHEQRGVEHTRRFLERMKASPRLIEEVAPLVAEHMRPIALHASEASDAAIRRLAVRVGRIDRLVRVARADSRGRPPLPDDGFPAGKWLLKQARNLDVEQAAPPRMIQGRHLMALGQRPGEHFGEILEQLYEDQLGGLFSTEEAGLDRARTLLEKTNRSSIAGQDVPDPD